MRKTIITTIPTLIIGPNDCSSAVTTVFIEELWLMNRSGLSILRSLRILITGRSTLVRLASISEVTTMKKSS